jgi:hypothetical protein
VLVKFQEIRKEEKYSGNQTKDAETGCRRRQAARQPNDEKKNGKEPSTAFRILNFVFSRAPKASPVQYLMFLFRKSRVPSRLLFLENPNDFRRVRWGNQNSP